MRANLALPALMRASGCRVAPRAVPCAVCATRPGTEARTVRTWYGTTITIHVCRRDAALARIASRMEAV